METILNWLNCWFLKNFIDFLETFRELRLENIDILWVMTLMFLVNTVKVHDIKTDHIYFVSKHF